MSADSFRHGTRTGYGLHKCRCDECHAAQLDYDRNYRAANRQRIAEKQRRYYETHRQQELDKARVRYEGDIDTQRARWRRYWDTNSAELVENKRRYRESAQRQMTAQQKRRNDRSRENATRNGRPWTSEEDQIVMDVSLSLPESASTLGRTISAVSGRRYTLRNRVRP